MPQYYAITGGYIDFGENVSATLKWHSIYKDPRKERLINGYVPEYGREFYFFQTLKRQDFTSQDLTHLRNLGYYKDSWITPVYVHGKQTRKEIIKNHYDSPLPISRDVSPIENANQDGLAYRTRHTFYYVVKSDTDQEITVRIFIADPRKTFTNTGFFPELTFIDPIHDIMHPYITNHTRMIASYKWETDPKKWYQFFPDADYITDYSSLQSEILQTTRWSSYKEENIVKNEVSSLQFEKKYMVTTFQASDLIEHPFVEQTILTIIPYYEAKVMVFAWENALSIWYTGYSPDVGHITN